MEEDWFFIYGAFSAHPGSKLYGQTLKNDASGFFIFKKRKEIGICG